MFLCSWTHLKEEERKSLELEHDRYEFTFSWFENSSRKVPIPITLKFLSVSVFGGFVRD